MKYEVREYYISRDKTLLIVNTHKNGGYDFKDATKRPSKGMLWQFEKSTEDNTFYQSRNPVLPKHSDLTTFWEANDISKDMVKTAYDACKETTVGSWSKDPYETLNDTEWLAGESERDENETKGMSKC